MLDLYFGHICHATVCLSELQFPPDHTTLTTHPLLLRPSVNPSGASNVKHQQLKQGRHTQMQLTTDTISPDLYYLKLFFFPAQLLKGRQWCMHSINWHKGKDWGRSLEDMDHSQLVRQKDVANKCELCRFNLCKNLPANMISSSLVLFVLLHLPQ